MRQAVPADLTLYAPCHVHVRRQYFTPLTLMEFGPYGLYSTPAPSASSWSRNSALVKLRGGGGANIQKRAIHHEAHRNQWATHTHWSAGYMGSHSSPCMSAS